MTGEKEVEGRRGGKWVICFLFFVGIVRVLDFDFLELDESIEKKTERVCYRWLHWDEWGEMAV